MEESQNGTWISAAQVPSWTLIWNLPLGWSDPSLLLTRNTQDNENAWILSVTSTWPTISKFCPTLLHTLNMSTLIAD